MCVCVCVCVSRMPDLESKLPGAGIPLVEQLPPSFLSFSLPPPLLLFLRNSTLLFNRRHGDDGDGGNDGGGDGHSLLSRHFGRFPLPSSLPPHLMPSWRAARCRPKPFLSLQGPKFLIGCSIARGASSLFRLCLARDPQFRLSTRLFQRRTPRSSLVASNSPSASSFLLGVDGRGPPLSRATEGGREEPHRPRSLGRKRRRRLLPSLELLPPLPLSPALLLPPTYSSWLGVVTVLMGALIDKLFLSPSPRLDAG